MSALALKVMYAFINNSNVLRKLSEDTGSRHYYYVRKLDNHRCYSFPSGVMI